MSLPLRHLFALLFVVFVVTAAPAAADAQEGSADPTVEVSYGGWGAVGGTLTWAAFAPVMQQTVKLILSPSDPSICQITPERCVPTVLDYSLAGLTVLGTMGVTVLGGWGTAELTKSLEIDPKLGWGFSGGVVGVPIFGMLWLSIPKFEPGWLDTTVGTVFTLGGAFATGYYTAEVAGKRGHAWPEFGFGLGGTLVGAGIGSLVCGSESCVATTLFGALGGLMGIGMTTLLWGTDPGSNIITDDATMSGALQQRPLMNFGGQF